jgi:colanic acid/amylovoran biosynthesis protein
MRVLITNSVPLNGGDEALLRATLAVLRDQFPSCSIKVLCKDIDICKRYLLDLDLDSDLEHIHYPRRVTSRRVLRVRTMINDLAGPSWTARLSRVLANREERRIIGIYKSADLVVSSAGGFLHDFYGIEHRLFGFEMALELGRPVVILGQSVGPFWKPRSKERARAVLSRLDAVLLREECSRRHLQTCGVDMSRVRVATDIAFYWRRMAAHLFVEKKGPVRKIAMSFRQWTHGGVSSDELVTKAAELCRHLLQTGAEVELVFLSTCQGIPEYVDDSLVARAVVNALPEDLRARCRIDAERHPPERLIQLYSQMDAYIGMRLHGAILAMLGGTPAMAIAYEDKTPGIFASLGLEAYQVDHRDGEDHWVACAENFIRRIDEIRRKLPVVLDEAAEKLDVAKRALADTVANGRGL